VIRSKEELYQRVDQLQNRLLGTMKYRLSNLRSFLASKVGSRGFAVAEAGIRRLSQRVDDLTFRLEQVGRSGAFIGPRTHQVALAEQRLANRINQVLRTSHQAFARIAHTLDALSPLGVLERGYAICQTPDGRVVRSADEVDVDSSVTVRLHQGKLLT